MGVVGMVMAPITSSQAILLDGLFNLTYFASGLFTIKVASLVAGGDDQRFPHGYAFFEPLVNGIKGMLVLGVSVAAMVGAIQALLGGGREIAAAMAIGYGLFASSLCWGVSYITWRGAKETQSPLVRADAENWIVNAAISSCVLIAFTLMFLLRAIGLDWLTPYVDPIVVLAVVAISILVPVRMAHNALMALLNRAPTQEVVDQVTSIIDANLADVPVKERFIRVTQPGRQRMVLAHIVLPDDYELNDLGSLDALREKIYAGLRDAHAVTIADVLFTTNRKWGAPLSDGGFADASDS